MFKKLLSVGVICLLIGLNSIPLVSAKESSNGNDFYWGFILDKYLETAIYSWDSNITESWGVAFDFSYYIFGIGRHDINVEYSYNFTVLDIDTNETMQIVGNLSFNDELYLFQPSKNPVMKLKASGFEQTDVFWYFIEGNWSGTIESNGKLIYERDFYIKWEK